MKRDLLSVAATVAVAALWTQAAFAQRDLGSLRGVGQVGSSNVLNRLNYIGRSSRLGYTSVGGIRSTRTPTDFLTARPTANLYQRNTIGAASSRQAGGLGSQYLLQPALDTSVSSSPQGTVTRSLVDTTRFSRTAASPRLMPTLPVPSYGALPRPTPSGTTAESAVPMIALDEVVGEAVRPPGEKARPRSMGDMVEAGLQRHFGRMLRRALTALSEERLADAQGRFEVVRGMFPTDPRGHLGVLACAVVRGEANYAAASLQITHKRVGVAALALPDGASDQLRGLCEQAIDRLNAVVTPNAGLMMIEAVLRRALGQTDDARSAAEAAMSQPGLSLESREMLEALLARLTVQSVGQPPTTQPTD